MKHIFYSVEPHGLWFVGPRLQSRLRRWTYIRFANAPFGYPSKCTIRRIRSMWARNACRSERVFLVMTMAHHDSLRGKHKIWDAWCHTHSRINETRAATHEVNRSWYAPVRAQKCVAVRPSTLSWWNKFQIMERIAGSFYWSRLCWWATAENKMIHTHMHNKSASAYLYGLDVRIHGFWGWFYIPPCLFATLLDALEAPIEAARIAMWMRQATTA